MPSLLGSIQTLDTLVHMKQRTDYASATINYYGLANPGTATSAASWQIKRETLDSSGRTIQIDWADSNTEYDNIWDNHAAASQPYG